MIPHFFFVSRLMKFEKVNYKLLLKNLEDRINELKIEYENYFMGVSLREPYALKKEVEKIIRSMLNRSFGSTSYNFKFRQLTARFNTYNQYWQRTMRKIEAGTYERDKFKLALKEKSHPPRLKSEQKAEKETETSEDEMHKKLYKDLITTRRKCKEPVNKLGYKKFKELIEKQTNDIKKQYKCKTVEFKIVVDNGKTKLKAFPK